MNNVGSGYTSAPFVQVTDNGSGPVTGGTFQAQFDSTTGTVTGINVIDGGTGYQFPVVTLIGGGGTGATATPTLSAGGVGGIQVDKGFSFLVDFVDASVSNGLDDNRTVYAKGVLKLIDSNYVFEAEIIKTSCPSKYEE